MKAALRGVACVVLGVGLALLVVFSVRAQREEKGEARGGTVAPRYSVVHTEGHNLIVTDNQTNKCYFYTIEADADLGAELHMRGYFDLTQVGQKTIKPTAGKLKKKKAKRPVEE
jgi:hypothetical protein